MGRDTFVEMLWFWMSFLTRLMGGGGVDFVYGGCEDI